MSDFSFFDPSNGQFTGRIFHGDSAGAQLNCNGLEVIPGSFDHLSQRVDIAATAAARAVALAAPPVVIGYKPSAPPDDAKQTWGWDQGSKRWLSVATRAAHAETVRVQRDARLAQCDWIVTKSAERGVAVPQPWRAYREALRDLPTQAGFPDAVLWPEIPSLV